MEGLVKLKGINRDFPNSAYLATTPPSKALYWGEVMESPFEEFKPGDIAIIDWGHPFCVLTGGYYYIKPEFLEKQK